MKNLDDYLNPTEIIDSNHPAILEYARKTAGNAPDGNTTDEISIACRLFTAVRDEIAYNPRTHFYLKSHYQASNVLERKSGYCVSKACLLCALGRASGIPSRLGLADIRNYGASWEVVELMGTNIFTYHGFVEFFLDGQWVKATPAFDRPVYEKHHIPLLEFNGREDAVFPSHDLNGKPYVDYMKYHGSFADLPLNDLVQAFRKIYGEDRVDFWIEMLESELPNEERNNR
ncbi:MAG: transglutaminase domain-containing protein [Desulfobacteraceae bacterium]|nr:transglutaminase domain-containing protein [Desulfobacteraceae bacterium]MBC2757537.1 transglutaminase domain-containing protein [Desulfobacteraceae bacterium]